MYNTGTNTGDVCTGVKRKGGVGFPTRLLMNKYTVQVA